MSNGNPDIELENLRTVYRELCSSYRAIDDFRTKLLGFLPVVTGTGLFFLVTDQAKIEMAQLYFRPIGIFGFVVTLGLFFYELYGIKKCGSLIRAGRELEEKLKIGNGQFIQRPHGVLGLINEPFAAGVIYPAVLAAWTFVALAFSQDQGVARRWAIRIFLVGFALLFSYNLMSLLKRLIRNRRSAT